jgi:hypothetical protein
VDASNSGPGPPEAWHVLLAPLPDGVVPKRNAAAPDSVLASPEGGAIAGWEHAVVWLSAGTAGLRVVLVVLDASGRAISASDGVVYRHEIAGAGPDGAPAVAWRQESLGGRLEPDGSFRGTHWVSTSIEEADGTARDAQLTPSEPTAAEAARLRALVDEVLRRLPPRGPV